MDKSNVKIARAFVGEHSTFAAYRWELIDCTDGQHFIGFCNEASQRWSFHAEVNHLTETLGIDPDIVVDGTVYHKARWSLACDRHLWLVAQGVRLRILLVDNSNPQPLEGEEE